MDQSVEVDTRGCPEENAGEDGRRQGKRRDEPEPDGHGCRTCFEDLSIEVDASGRPQEQGGEGGYRNDKRTDKRPLTSDRRTREMCFEERRMMAHDYELASPSGDVNHLPKRILTFEEDLAYWIAEMGEHGGDHKYARAPDAIKNNPLVARALVEHSGAYLKKLPETLRDDKDIVLAACASSYLALEHASDRLRDDRDVVAAAIRGRDGRGGGGGALCRASERLRGDKGLVLAAVAGAGFALEHASPALRGDRDVVMAAVSCRAWGSSALKFASDELKEDRGILAAAVEADGEAIEHVRGRLVPGDRGVVLAAVRSKGRALGYLSGHLPAQRGEFPGNFHMLGMGGNVATGGITPACRGFLDDREIVLAAVGSDGQAFEYASTRLRGDREIAIEAVKKWGFALKHASKTLQDDKDVVMLAVLSNDSSLEYASERLRNDREVVMTAIATCQVVLGHAKGSRNYLDPVCPPLDLASGALCNDAETMLSVYENNCRGRCYEVHRISASLRRDQTFVLHGARIAGGEILNIASKRLANDPAVAEAVEQHDAFVRWKKEFAEKTQQQAHLKKVSSAATPKDSPKGDDPFQHYKKSFNFQRLCNDENLAWKAVRHDGINLRNVSKELCCDRALVQAAVRDNGRALQWAFPPFRNDRDVVLEAVASRGAALEFASPSLRSDPDVVRVATGNDGGALLFADEKFRGDARMVLRCIASCGDRERAVKIFKALPNEVKARRDVIKAVVETGRAGASTALYLGGKDACDDEELVHRAISLDPVNCFKYASKQIRGMRWFVVKALESNPRNIGLIPRELLMQSGFVQELASIVRFSMQMHRLGVELFTSPVETDTTEEDWIRVLDQSNKLFNPILSLSAIYRFLSLHPEICNIDSEPSIDSKPSQESTKCS